jgi:hypothetical protein
MVRAVPRRWAIRADEHHRERRRERAAAEEREVDERVGDPPLTPDEDEAEHGADGDRQQGRRRAATTGDLLEAVDDRQDRGERQDRAGHVDLGAGVPVGLRQHAAPDDDEHHHERDAEQERRAPPEVLQQDATDEGTDGHAAHEARVPDADRRHHRLLVGEDRPDQAHRRRHEGGARDADQRPPDDQLTGARGVRGAHARSAETHRTDEQEPLAPDAVPDRAHRHEEAGEDEGVDVEHPQLLGRRGAEVGGQLGQGEVEDADVQRQEQGRQGQDAEGDPLSPGRP